MGVGSFLLLILSEILPIIRPVYEGADEEEAQRVHGIVQFITLIIRTQWVRHHPMVRDLLRFTRDVIAEENIPPSPETPEVVLEPSTPLSMEGEEVGVVLEDISVAEEKPESSGTVSSRTRSSDTSFKAIDIDAEQNQDA